MTKDLLQSNLKQAHGQVPVKEMGKIKKAMHNSCFTLL